MSVSGVTATGLDPIQSVGGSTLERAQRLVAEAPGQAKAFQHALQTAAPTSGSSDDAVNRTTSTNRTDSDIATNRPGVLGGQAARTAAAEEAIRNQPGAAERMLQQVEAGHQRLNTILQDLDSGRTFSAREMLSIQAEMHQVMGQLETATKVMGEVVSGTKTLLQQQI